MIKWLYEKYVLTGLIVIYYLALTGYGTYQLFSNATQINMAGATAYGSLLALPAAAVALIKWRIEKDNE